MHLPQDGRFSKRNEERRKAGEEQEKAVRGRVYAVSRMKRMREQLSQK